MTRVPFAVLLFWLVAGPAPGYGQSSHRAVARCRGSTHARVRITWPSSRDLKLDRQLSLGRHVPQRIARWAYLIVPDARAAGVDPTLVAAVIRIESNGDPLVWSLDSDAHGLMQILHAPFEPTVNIGVGVGMLADLQRQFHRRDLVLAGYNAGAGAVRQYGGVPPFTETRDYVVLAEYFHDLFAGRPLSRTRVAQYHAALADLRAFKRRVCSQP